MATKAQLAEFVARRMLNEIGDFDSLEEWSELFLQNPEKYVYALALSAVDCIQLSDALRYDPTVLRQQRK